MRSVALFVEDSAHQRVIGALVRRLADEHCVAVRLDWRSAVRGHGRVVQELKQYLDNLQGEAARPDVIVVATDANCAGLQQRTRDIGASTDLAPIVLAIPDPHIERWLLLDSAAFKSVFGKGCDAPDRKCERGRYKYQLSQAIHAAGEVPQLGGIEFAEDIVGQMDIPGVADQSFRRFVDELRHVFRQWSAE